MLHSPPECGSGRRDRGKEKLMNRRVMSRLGARELTVKELEQVSGSQIVRTDNCSIITTKLTGSGDGDGCTDIIHDA
jgi:hypothetical protein